MISTSGVTLQFGKRVLFKDVSIKFTPGIFHGADKFVNIKGFVHTFIASYSNNFTFNYSYYVCYIITFILWKVNVSRY